MTGTALPIGLNLASIGVEPAWWLEAAVRAEAAGYASAWIWDHFVSRGRLTDPVLECWSMIAAATVATSRIRLGSFVTNVMNRHPAVLARIVATLGTLAPGRIELGIGSGGHPAEHHAYGIPFPAGSERDQHLDEAISVIGALLAGGPADFVGKHYRLEAAYAHPVPEPRPRIVVAGTTPLGARTAARRGDAWTCFAVGYETLRPIFLAALAEAGRRPEEVPVIVGIEVDEMGDDLDQMSSRWQARGASELIVHDVRPRHLDHVLDMAGGG